MGHNGEGTQASADEGAGMRPVCGGGRGTPSQLALQGQSMGVKAYDTGRWVSSNSDLSLLVQPLAGRSLGSQASVVSREIRAEQYGPLELGSVCCPAPWVRAPLGQKGVRSIF